MKKFISTVAATALALSPALALAQNTNPSVETIIEGPITGILNAIIPILITLGVIYFIWGIVQYVIADDEAAKEKGKNRMLYGLVGLFVIVTFWGLIEVIQNTLDIDPTTPTIPDINPYE
jgi:hypothetical protein